MLLLRLPSSMPVSFCICKGFLLISLSAASMTRRAAGAVGCRGDSGKAMEVSPCPGQEDCLLGDLASWSLPSTFHPTPCGSSQPVALTVASTGLPRVLTAVLTGWAVGTDVGSNSSRGRVTARSSWERAREDMAPCSSP